MRTINTECKTVKENGEIEIGFRDVDVFDSMYEYASYYKYFQSPTAAPADETLPKKYRVFPLEFRPFTDPYFNKYVPEFDIVIDGITYFRVDCNEAPPFLNRDNNRLSYIPCDEIYTNLYTLSCFIMAQNGCVIYTKPAIFRTLEDAENALPEFDAEMNRYFENYPDEGKLLEALYNTYINHNSIVENFPKNEKHFKEEEKRREERKRRWNEEIKGLFFVVQKTYPFDTPIFGVGKTEKEALIDARGRIDLDQFQEEFERLARWVFGTDYSTKLSEESPSQYNPNDDSVKMKGMWWFTCYPAYISHKAYNAIKMNGYDTKLYLDVRNEITTTDVYKLPEEINEQG